MAFTKFQENMFRIDGEIAENHAILVDLTASIDPIRLMQQSMYSPTQPTAGQPGGYHGGYLGVCCFFKPLGCGGFLKFCPQIEITGFVYIENHSDYSSDCKIIVLILQNIAAVMFKFSGGLMCDSHICSR